MIDRREQVLTALLDTLAGEGDLRCSAASADGMKVDLTLTPAMSDGSRAMVRSLVTAAVMGGGSAHLTIHGVDVGLTPSEIQVKIHEATQVDAPIVPRPSPRTPPKPDDPEPTRLPVRPLPTMRPAAGRTYRQHLDSLSEVVDLLREHPEGLTQTQLAEALRIFPVKNLKVPLSDLLQTRTVEVFGRDRRYKVRS